MVFCVPCSGLAYPIPFLRTLYPFCVPYTLLAYPVPGPQAAAPAPAAGRRRCGMPPGHVTCVPCSGLAYPIPDPDTGLGGPPQPQATPTAAQVAREPQVFVPHPNPSPNPNPNPGGLRTLYRFCVPYTRPGHHGDGTRRRNRAPGAATAAGCSRSGPYQAGLQAQSLGPEETVEQKNKIRSR
jgi:hypothetical protein